MLLRQDIIKTININNIITSLSLIITQKHPKNSIAIKLENTI